MHKRAVTLFATATVKVVVFIDHDGYQTKEAVRKAAINEAELGVSDKEWDVVRINEIHGTEDPND